MGHFGFTVGSLVCYVGVTLGHWSSGEVEQLQHGKLLEHSKSQPGNVLEYLCQRFCDIIEELRVATAMEVAVRLSAQLY